MSHFYDKGKSSIAFMVCISTLVSLFLNILFSTPARAETSDTSTLDMMDGISFSEDNSVFTNPERGWLRMYMTDDIWGLDKLKSQGISMILLEANLKDFLTTPISDAKLSEIRSAFSKARQNGLEVIFRAAYDFDGVTACEPKSLDIITGHIAQLKSIFYDYEDVLYCVQAGFLGPWGEWHSSYYGDPPSLEARKTVLFALMDAVPKSRSIEIRRPMFIRDIYDGQTITASSAFNGSNLSRTGYHDDALLSTKDENGTYVESGYSRSAELSWVNNHDKYTPFVGESDMLTSYSDPDNAVSELNMLHAQSLNIDYYPGVISKWKSTTYSGMNTYDYITSRLGYRLLLTDAKISTQVNKGGVLHLTVNIKNDGFANLINAREFDIVLSNGTKTYTAKVNDDVRKWYRENGIMTKDLYFGIPSDISSGTWNVYISLPSASSSLRGNPAYSIRLANTGVWDSARGFNLVKSGVQINNSYESNTVTSFTQISREKAEQLISTGENSTTPTSTPETPAVVPTATPVSTTTPTEEPVITPMPTPSVIPSATPSLPAPTPTVAPASAPTLVPTVAPTPTPTVAPTPTQAPIVQAPVPTSTLPEVRSMTITNDAGNLYLKVDGSKLNTKSQFFLNTDNKTTTGYRYKWTSSGFEYMIENNTLYKYVGKKNTWKWAMVQPLNVVKEDAIILATLPLRAIGASVGKTLQVGFISNDDSNLVYPKLNAALSKYTISLYVTTKATNMSAILLTSNLTTMSAAEVSSMTITNDKTNIYLKVDGSMLNTKSQFFLNTDKKNTTGYKYKWASSGFEYMIENNTLYKYTGTKNVWKWTMVQPLAVVKTDTGITITLPMRAIRTSAGKAIQAGFISDDNSMLVCPQLNVALPKYTIAKIK